MAPTAPIRLRLVWLVMSPQRAGRNPSKRVTRSLAVLAEPPSRRRQSGQRSHTGRGGCRKLRPSESGLMIGGIAERFGDPTGDSTWCIARERWRRKDWQLDRRGKVDQFVGTSRRISSNQFRTTAKAGAADVLGRKFTLLYPPPPRPWWHQTRGGLARVLLRGKAARSSRPRHGFRPARCGSRSRWLVP